MKTFKQVLTENTDHPVAKILRKHGWGSVVWSPRKTGNPIARGGYKHRDGDIERFERKHSEGDLAHQGYVKIDHKTGDWSHHYGRAANGVDMPAHQKGNGHESLKNYIKTDPRAPRPPEADKTNI